MTFGQLYRPNSNPVEREHVDSVIGRARNARVLFPKMYRRLSLGTRQTTITRQIRN